VSLFGKTVFIAACLLFEGLKYQKDHFLVVSEKVCLHWHRIALLAYGFALHVGPSDALMDGM
jgi:hypothetical protein